MARRRVRDRRQGPHRRGVETLRPDASLPGDLQRPAPFLVGRHLLRTLVQDEAAARGWLPSHRVIRRPLVTARTCSTHVVLTTPLPQDHVVAIAGGVLPSVAEILLRLHGAPVCRPLYSCRATIGSTVSAGSHGRQGEKCAGRGHEG